MIKFSIAIESTEIDEFLNALTDFLTDPGEGGALALNPGENFTPDPPDNLIPNPPDNTIPPPPDTTGAAKVEVDSEGLPWDARIHGAKKAKLAKTQAWKKKRGLDPATVAQVEAELRAALGGGVVVDPGANIPDPNVIPDQATALYGVIMADLSKWIGEGTFTPEDVSAVLLGLNVPDLGYLKTCNDVNVLSTVKAKLGEKWLLNTAT